MIEFLVNIDVDDLERGVEFTHKRWVSRLVGVSSHFLLSN